MKNPVVIAAAAVALAVIGLIAQDGPETVARGIKQFKQTEIVTSARASASRA